MATTMKAFRGQAANSARRAAVVPRAEVCHVQTKLMLLCWLAARGATADRRERPGQLITVSRVAHSCR